jgi:hypothetical protein
MALTLTFDQADAGLPAGVTDRARTDLVSTGLDEVDVAYPVVINVGGVPDGASADIALLDEPPGAQPLLTQQSATQWRLEFKQGVWGPFRVRARAISSGHVLESVTRRCSIRSPKLGLQYPANAERIDPNASSVSSVQSVALTEMNEGGTNRALVDFYREMIERVEAAIADGTVTAPPLFEQLYDDSIEHLSGKYRVQAALQTLINGAVQLGDRRLDFVYKLDAQQGDDVTVKMLNLRDKIQAEGGGVILLPPKVQFKTTRGLDFGFVERTAPIAIVGRHGYRAQWFYMPDSAHAEEPCMHFGYPDDTEHPAFAYGDIALAHFDLNTNDGSPGTHYGEQAAGVEFYAVNNSIIHDVRLRSFKRGLRLYGSTHDGNTQEIHLLNVIVATCLEWGLDLDLASNITAHRLYCGLNFQRDVSIQGVDGFLWSGGCIQSVAPYGVWAETSAGKQIRCVQIDHVYNETLNDERILFYFGVGSGGGGPTVSITNCTPQASFGGGTIYKMHGQSGVSVALTSLGNVAGYGNPDTVALDAQYADIVTDQNDMLCSQYGQATYNFGPGVRMYWGGSRPDRGGAHGSISVGLEPARSGVALQLAGGAFALAPYTSGTEPSLAEDNDMIARPDGPAVKLAGSWHALAFREELNLSVIGLLAPYASEIFDLGSTRLVEVISGEVNSLTGLLYGDVLSAPSSGRRPAYTASDPKFRGAPCMTSSPASSGKYLIGDLSHGSGIGDTPALLLVGYKIGSTAPTLRAFMAVQNAAANGNTLLIASDDVNAAGYWYAVDDRTAVAGSNFATLTTEPMDEFARVLMAWQKPAEGLYLRVNGHEVANGPTQGPNDVALPKAVLGACWTGAAITAESVAVTLAVYFKNPPPQPVIDKAFQLLQDRYGAY